jgi:hypothetical protein
VSSHLAVVTLVESVYAVLHQHPEVQMSGTINQHLAAPGGEPWHHFAGLLLVILLAVLQGRAGRIGAFWQICWALPGTILHEISHLVVATVTGGRPVGFSVVPRRQGGDRWLLGSVTISRPGPISALPSALAPLALNGVAYYLYRGWTGWFPPDLPHTLLMYATIYLFCYSSIPSGQDFKVACSSTVGLFLYTAMGGALWYLWR